MTATTTAKHTHLMLTRCYGFHFIDILNEVSKKRKDLNGKAVKEFGEEKELVEWERQK